MRRAARCRKYSFYAFGVIAVLLLIYFISALFCGFTWDSCSSKSDDTKKTESSRLLREQALKFLFEINDN